MKSELSSGEWTLMNQLWDAPYSTITELTNALREATGWGKHTILSMLSRLEGKGAAAYREGTRAKEFYAVLSREDAVRREAARFLGTICGGSPSRMARAIADALGLSASDAAELAAILADGTASDWEKAAQ